MQQDVTGGGSMGVTLTVGRARHEVSPASLVRTSQDSLKAAETLDPALTAGPFGFVSAQCLELALKAYLMAGGMTERNLINEIGHDLSKAWSRCVEDGLSIDVEMPAWAKHLDAGHEYPYLFRYGKDNIGIILSPKDTVLDGLRHVLAMVQDATAVI